MSVKTRRPRNGSGPHPEAGVLTAAGLLVKKHHRQIICRKQETFDKMSRVTMLTWRPGDHTYNFVDKAFCPLGSAVLLVLSHAMQMIAGELRRVMVLSGFKAEIDTAGNVTYCNLFSYNLQLKPFRHARGRVIDPVRNPSLIERGLAMARAGEKRLDDTYRLSVVPVFPRIAYGFAPQEELPFVDTPALRQLAALRLDVPVAKLDTQSLVPIDSYLRLLWESRIILPGQAGNTTPHKLIDAELRPSVFGSLGVYEDFRQLLNSRVRNPVRVLLAAERVNPAQAVYAELGITPSDEFFESVDLDLGDRLELAMRKAVGPGHELFTTEELAAGLHNPAEPIRCNEDLAQLGAQELFGEQTVRYMRDLLIPYDSECCTDADILSAATDPKAPLILSGGCGIQVLYNSGQPLAQALYFDQRVTGRRLEANLYHPWETKEPVDAPAVPAAA